jgi:cobalt-zinc-cadmium efflux system outer membrane protein
VGRAEAAAAADLATARAALDESAARWHRYRDDLRPRSEQIRRSVSLAYERGGASLLDLLEAQRNDNEVRMDTMQAASDAASAAAALAAALTSYAPGARR